MGAVQTDRRRVRGDAEVAQLTTVILIDDRTLTRQCLAHWLELSDPHLRIVGVPRLDQPERLRHYGRIDLAVLSIGSFLAADPVVAAMLGRLHEMMPEVPQIVVSDREDIRAVTEAIKRGVRGYIPTSLDPHVVVEALRFVQAGGTFVPASALINAATAAAADPGPATSAGPTAFGFTRREREVLGHLRQGKPNKIIAYELKMQESTVKVHVRRIMKKLNATNRTQAAFLAQQMDAAPDRPDTGICARHADHIAATAQSINGGSNLIGRAAATE
jgi:DNA-binding NarL/FixJ family response regulator